jgi:ubiquitin-protein ligase
MTIDGRQGRLINDYRGMIDLRDQSSGMLEFNVDRTYRHYNVILHGIRTYVAKKNGGYQLEDDHKFTIDIPEEYPLKEPTFKFARPLYHPNWYMTGIVCLGVLRDSSNWDPGTKLKDLVIDVTKMMTFEIANPNSPANGLAAGWYLENKNLIRRQIPRIQLQQSSGDALEFFEDDLDITEL